MIELLLLPFKLVIFVLKLAFGLLFLVFGMLLIPLLILAGIGFAIRCLVC